jgi:predicted nucleic acid-binding protein
LIWYLDTSLALHALLPTGDARAAEWLDQANRTGSLYSSTLLELEIVRVLRRERLAIERAGEVLDRVNLVSIDDGVLRAGAAIEPHVRSSDAIHLATCALLGSDAALATHDAGMRETAYALGRSVIDPLADAGQP